MRDPLAVLIRMRRFRLDEERKRLAASLQRCEQLEQDLMAIGLEIEQERREADADPLAATTLAAYLRAADQRRQRLDADLESARRETEQLRDVVKACWRDARSLEEALEQRRRQQAQALQQRERLTLDEVALIQHARKGRRHG